MILVWKNNDIPSVFDLVTRIGIVSLFLLRVSTVFFLGMGAEHSWDWGLWNILTMEDEGKV